MQTTDFTVEELAENPWFTTAAISGTASFPTMGSGVGLRFRGALDPSGVVLEGTQLDLLLADVSCDILEQFFDCGPCGDGSGLFCTVIEIDQIPVEPAATFPVRTDQDVTDDPGCMLP